MEDAMIINKASEERGLAHGLIYKSEFIELSEPTAYFCRDPTQESLSTKLDSDGLPYHGRKMQDGEPFYSYYSPDQSKYIVPRFSGKEECYVHNVKLCGQFAARSKMLACVTFRVPVSLKFINTHCILYLWFSEKS